VAHSCADLCSDYWPTDGDCYCNADCFDNNNCCPDLCEVCPDDYYVSQACENCTPKCTNKECGADSCGGSCGTCGDNEVCNNGVCDCVPDCSGKECGDDGCGNSCGPCGADEKCTANQCVACTPDCTGKDCGDNGCDGTCGSCLGFDQCVNFKCIECVPKCTARNCGNDSCGGTCGECDPGVPCKNGVCTTCTPGCNGKVCGVDECGTSCGTCASGKKCIAGTCVTDSCKPACTGNDCGDDNCGGVCGVCPPAADKTKYMCYDNYFNNKCTAPPAYIDLSCQDIGYCIDLCAAGNYTCAYTCEQNGSYSARIDWQDLTDCYTANGYYECADQPCKDAIIKGDCSTQYLSCFQGTLECSAIYDCVRAHCTAGDAKCAAHCLAYGTADAQDSFALYANCVANICGVQPTAECLLVAESNACAASLLLCVK
jgi:hypothetical protein